MFPAFQRIEGLLQRPSVETLTRLVVKARSRQPRKALTNAPLVKRPGLRTIRRVVIADLKSSGVQLRKVLAMRASGSGSATLPNARHLADVVILFLPAPKGPDDLSKASTAIHAVAVGANLATKAVASVYPSLMASLRGVNPSIRPVKVYVVPKATPAEA